MHDDKSIPTNSACSLFVVVENMAMTYNVMIMFDKFNVVRISTSGHYECTCVTE